MKKIRLRSNVIEIRLPYNTSGVHCESNKFRLVEILRYFSGFDGIYSANGNQQHIIELREQKRHVLNITFQYDLFSNRIMVASARWLNNHPNHGDYNLNG